MIILFGYLSKCKGFIGNLVAMIIVAGGGGYFGSQYVNAANMEFKKEIKKNIEKIQVLDKSQQQMQTSFTIINNNLKNLNNSLKAVKKSVDQTNRQTVQIYRDLLNMRNGG